MALTIATDDDTGMVVVEMSANFHSRAPVAATGRITRQNYPYFSSSLTIIGTTLVTDKIPRPDKTRGAKPIALTTVMCSSAPDLWPSGTIMVRLYAEPLHLAWALRTGGARI